jgi:biopolymer transport protein ExbB/TolQ
MIKFKCPLENCGRIISANDDAAGQRRLCPYCNGVVVVPGEAASPPAVPPAPAEPQVSPSPVTPSESDARRPREQWSTSFAAPVSQSGMLKDFLAGLIASAVLFGVMGLLRVILDWQPGFIVKLMDRGWTPYAAVLLAFWSGAILASKARMARDRRVSLTAGMLPDTQTFYTDADIEAALAGVRARSHNLKDRVLAYRLRRALEHYLVSKNVKEVDDILREDSDASYAETDSSYTPVRVFLWAIPILGFIGTVIGVGAAVGGFADFLSGAQQIDQIKNALTGVTKGLAVAFDTTYVALVLSLLVMMFMSAIHRVEEDLLRQLDGYCERHLLRRLPANRSAQQQSGVIPGALTEMVKDIRSGIETWTAEVRRLGDGVAAGVKGAWQEAGQEWSAGVKSIQESMAANVAWREGVLDRMKDEREHLQRNAAELLTGMRTMLDEQQRAVREILSSEREAIAQAARSHQMQVQEYVNALVSASGALQELVALQNKLEADLLEATGSEGLVKTLREIHSCIGRLGPSIERLTEKPLEVEVHLTAGQAVLPGK